MFLLLNIYVLCYSSYMSRDPTITVSTLSLINICPVDGSCFAPLLWRFPGSRTLYCIQMCVEDTVVFIHIIAEFVHKLNDATF